MEAIAARLTELDDEMELSLSEIFDVLCTEFDLDGASISETLGCKCPYGLVGFLAED